jgi:hypothetical protein
MKAQDQAVTKLSTAKSRRALDGKAGRVETVRIDYSGPTGVEADVAARRWSDRRKPASRMGIANKLLLIAAGYALSIACAATAVAVHMLLASADDAQNSGGMAAFGDMILFVLIAGGLGLVPTFFVLKLAVEKAPRALLVGQIIIAVLGPVSWLAVLYPASAGVEVVPQAARELLVGLFAFSALPRILAGPAIMAIEGVTFLLVRKRATRVLLAFAMLMDFVPLSLFALHLAGAAQL